MIYQYTIFILFFIIDYLPFFILIAIFKCLHVSAAK